jgi:hypothetical protein
MSDEKKLPDEELDKVAGGAGHSEDQLRTLNQPTGGEDSNRPTDHRRMPPD